MATTRFALLSLLTLVVLGAATVLINREVASEVARRDAQSHAEEIARNVAGPLVDSGVRTQQPAAMTVLGSAMLDRIREGAVSHIVLWDLEGRVLWAEDADVIGEVFDISSELRAIGRRGGTFVEESSGDADHPVTAEREAMHEVYVDAVGADGEPFIFEAYLPQKRIDQLFSSIVADSLPLSLAMLVLLQLANLPLALSLARRIDRSNAQRSAILQRSLSSWHVERRHLAQSLHDGVIQDLSAMSYALPAVIEKLPPGDDTDQARAVGERMGNILRRSLASLRATTLDLSPADLNGGGILPALESLQGQSRDRGLDVRLAVEPGVDLGETTTGLIYRIVREGLRNVEKHAAATSAVVTIARRGDLVEVTLEDDGQGLSSSSPVEPGHIGLRLHGQLVRDVGGTLTVGAGPQGGTILRAVLPARFPDLDEHH